MSTGVQRRGRIDDRRLIQALVRDGRSQADCARDFGVSEQAISQRLRVLGLDGARPRAALSHLDGAARGAFDIAARITELDGLLHAELAALSEGGVDLAEPERFQRLVTLVAESRKTCGTAIELSRALHAIHEVGVFRTVILDVLDEFPEVKARLIARLRERATLDRALTRLPSGGRA